MHIAALALLLAADVEGSKDHPLVTRMPGYEITDYNQVDFEAFDFPVKGEKQQHVEGKRTHLGYATPPEKKHAGLLQIVRNYQAALKKVGGEVLVENGSETTIRVKKGAAETWVWVSAANDGEMYQVDIVEKGAMQQDVVADAAGMKDALAKTGRVTLYINFDTNKATIKKDSEKIIKEIVRLLTEDATLKLRVEGHTDDVGDAAKNQQLSEQRAAAVVAALVKAKIGKDRLSAKGFGAAQPLVENTSEENRAKNRRVELVKQE